MAKIKLFLSVIFLCYFAGVVFGSGSSESGSKSESEDFQNATSNLKPAVNSELSLVLQRLEAQELRIRELEKSGEECKSLKIFYQKSHEELKKQLRSSRKSCDEQFKTLRKEVDQLKSENCVGDDVWLLRPPIRGRRGQKGEKGDSGVIATTPGENPGTKGQVQIPTPRPTAAGPKEISTIPAPPSKLITSCSAAMETLPPPRSKKQTIYPHASRNKTKVDVLCDFETDGGGWTIIQKRIRGPKEEFKQNWNGYKAGFGSLQRNFWLGLENIHALTQNGDQELRIQLEDFEGNKKYAKYSNFSISDASDFYKLTLGGFSGGSTLPDDMAYNNGRRFSTMDKDNDNWDGLNCAVERGGGGGWWFNSGCGWSNLNGLYFEKGETVPSYQGIYWTYWKGPDYSMANSEMKIRKRKP